MSWLRKIWAKLFKRQPTTKALRDLTYGEAVSIATLPETQQEYVWEPGEPCKPGHELDGTEFKSWRR